MKVVIASDHAGFELKQKLISFVESLGYKVIDKGAFKMNQNDDYPDYIELAAQDVSYDPHNCFGIVLGGSGQGEAIVANRFPHVRAIVYYGAPQMKPRGPRDNPDDYEIVKLGKEHNNANVLSLGARFLSEEQAKEAVKIWLETPFPGEERHERRIEKIDRIKTWQK